MKKYVIIVAGGSGSRMGGEIPKQFLLLNEKPVLAYTIERFYAYDADIEIIVCLPEDQIAYWEEVSREIKATWPKTPHITPGGSTRFKSVKNGLACITDEEGLVAIHDGVRPLVNHKTIERCFRTAATKGSAVAVVSVKDSVRQLLPDGTSVAIDRSALRLVQTPQIFRVKELKKAYQQAEIPTFTDDASVVEAAGYKVFLEEGHYENIKITTPEDLLLATQILIKHGR